MSGYAANFICTTTEILQNVKEQIINLLMLVEHFNCNLFFALRKFNKLVFTLQATILIRFPFPFQKLVLIFYHTVFG